MSASTRPDPAKQHERLIDHFKRVYSIVAGLALTEACKRTLPVESLADFRVWMFAILVVTLVPIFHGGDRSLDQKYWNRPPRDMWDRLGFVWDDYMLILTAVLFVCIAESIPSASDLAKPDSFTPDRFFFWTSAMFGFDVFVLGADLLKARDRRPELRPYRWWIPLNVALCLVCAWAARLTVLSAATQSVSLPWLGETTMLHLTLGLFAVAALRTLADYIVGNQFIFPGSGGPP